MFAFLRSWGKKCICFVLVNVLLISVMKTDVRLKSKVEQKILSPCLFSICLFGALIKGSWKLRILVFMESYRMVWIGMDLKDHLLQIPLMWAELSSTRFVASSPIPAWLWMLPGMEHSQLWATCSSSLPPL